MMSLNIRKSSILDATEMYLTNLSQIISAARRVFHEQCCRYTACSRSAYQLQRCRYSVIFQRANARIFTVHANMGPICQNTNAGFDNKCSGHLGPILQNSIAACGC